MRPPTVLLDLDGTLLDSAAGIIGHLSSAIASVGVAVPLPDNLRAFVGPPFEVVMPTLGLDPAQVVAAITEYRRTYDPVAASLSAPFPGITELLDRLRDHGIRLAVATSKPEALARGIVTDNGLAGYFEVIGGADATLGRTDKAAVVGSVLERLGMAGTGDPGRPGSARVRGGAAPLMVGDRLHDVHGASAHGLATIGVSWGYAEPGELIDAGAIAILDSPAELGDLLLRRLSLAA